MSFLGRLKDLFLDRSRDHICAALQSMGIDAQMAKRGRAEEGIFLTLGGYYDGLYPRGVIDIAKGPIRWVNVVEVDRQTTGGQPYHIVSYGVPDFRLWAVVSPAIEIKSGSKKNNWQWGGKDSGLGIINNLNNETLEYRFLKITIGALPELSCWVIASRVGDLSKELSKELWDYYQMIARHLLAEWPTDHELKIEPPKGEGIHYTCPQCSSSDIHKIIRRIPTSLQVADSWGFIKRQWDCSCFNCHSKWFEEESKWH